ncbi:MAG: entericidin A/B family lipoprotein [Prosthecobacter sp.]
MNTSPTTTTAPAIQDETVNRSVGWFVLVFGLAILTLSSLSSCNTTRGFGRDVQKVGNKIQRAAT